jgi:hypothetical protein
MRLAKILFLFFLAVSLAWAVLLRSNHDFEHKCFDCHVGLKDPAILTKGADDLCLSCHPEQKERSHPTGIVPAKAIPAVFPLYKNKMLCITCHIAHKTYDDKNSRLNMFDENPYLLRYKKTGKIFCYQCHSGGLDNFIDTKIDSHAIGFEMAHSRHNISMKESVDDDSRECLSCHDGTLSRDANVRVGVDWGHAKGFGLSHPIGIDYRQSYFKKPQLFHNTGS